MNSREKFEAWWVSENNGHQPRSSWPALRTEDGYNDEDIDLQWQGYQAATALMQAERDQLAAAGDSVILNADEALSAYKSMLSAAPQPESE